MSMPPLPPSPKGLFANYAPLSDRYEESRSDMAAMQGLWSKLGARLDELGDDGMATAWRRGEDLIREHGLGHDLIESHAATDRRWELDPVPLLLPHREWEQLAVAAKQRARLFDYILRDCYGAQELISEGVLPPASIFPNPRFFRGICDVYRPSQRMLHYMAVDIARGADGNWVVVADRTEAPNGTGFALENRLVLSRVFPDTSKNLNILRLASYFQGFMKTMRSLAPDGVDRPKIVMLSPGPQDSTYFEDAFLTRYLGITLAVGSELTVRNDRVFLKTIAGLERVHVIWRRVPGNDSDPLEMPTAEHIGVPGLVQALRAQTVAIVNPPGTGLMEAPALLPYLDGVSQYLFGEDLLLPSVPTQWGDPAPDLLQKGATVTKPAHERHSFEPFISRTMDPQAMESLKEEIARDPQRFAVQQEMNFSTAPVWTGNGLEPRPVAVRLFLYATDDGYEVMPGGLVRTASTPDSLPGLSLKEETRSKDLWVCGATPAAVAPTTNIPSRQTIRRRTKTLSSRAADNMLWIGRYSERAEFLIRILLNITETLDAEADAQKLPSVPPLARAISRAGYFDRGDIDRFSANAPQENLREYLDCLLRGTSSQDGFTPLDSIKQNIARLRQLCALSRDRLSTETWRIVQSLDAVVSEEPLKSRSGFRRRLQDALLLQSAFNGTCRENLTRNPSWNFLNMGRRLERAIWLSNVSEEILGTFPACPSTTLQALLDITDCSLTYRYRYFGEAEPLTTFDLVLFDTLNPRSLAFQLTELDIAFAKLPPTAEEAAHLRRPHATVRKALSFIQTESLQVTERDLEATLVGKLRHFITRFSRELPTVHEQLGWEFFTHANFTSSQEASGKL